MQTRHSKLTPEERQKRKEKGSCFYCGNSGQFVSQFHPIPQNNFLFIPIKIWIQSEVFEFQAFQNPAQHETHIRLVLERLLENQLYVKAEKWEFHVTTIPFLG